MPKNPESKRYQSPEERGLARIWVTKVVKERFDTHQGDVSQSDALAALLDAKPTAAPHIPWTAIEDALLGELGFINRMKILAALRNAGRPD